MKTRILLILISLAPLLSFSQSENEVYTGKSMNTALNLYSNSFYINNPFLPLTTSVTTGVNFGSLYSGNYFQSFLSPSVGFPVNKKLYLSTGITYSHTNFNNIPVWDDKLTEKRISGDLNTLTLSFSGFYKVNEKLNINGSAFKTINPAFNTRLDPQNIQSEAQGMSVGFDYQLNENTFIGAEIRFQQGYLPYNSFPTDRYRLFNNGL